MITESQCGLKTEWEGRVFMNPPYSKNYQFIKKFADYKNGICLVFARTETKWFQQMNDADAYYFFNKRLHFCDINGVPSKGNAGAPSVMVAYGEDNVDALKYFLKKHGGLLLGSLKLDTCN